MFLLQVKDNIAETKRDQPRQQNMKS